MTCMHAYRPHACRGHFDLVVKSYPNGTMSKHVGGLQVGDSMLVKGPIVKLPYKANMKKRVGMIAGARHPPILFSGSLAQNPKLINIPLIPKKIDSVAPASHVLAGLSS